jgi:hypothetical protein
MKSFAFDQLLAHHRYKKIAVLDFVTGNGEDCNQGGSWVVGELTLLLSRNLLAVRVICTIMLFYLGFWILSKIGAFARKTWCIHTNAQTTF